MIGKQKDPAFYDVVVGLRGLKFLDKGVEQRLECI